MKSIHSLSGSPETMAAPTPFFQAKLTVNQPGDAYEQEADAVADRVMRMAAPDAQAYEGSFSKVPISNLQRKCAACEEEDKLHRKEASSDAGGMTAPSLVSDVISGTGTPLDKTTRGFMESRMGKDFSDIRVHTDGQAAASAQSINALAYTSGNHIVFNSGQYQPNTDSGKRLLAHELVHTKQQGGGNKKSIQRKIEVRPPGKGEASAFDRRQELIDRLNLQSGAIQYELDGQNIKYKIIDESKLSFFDKEMVKFIDLTPIIPLRLITGSGLLPHGGGINGPAWFDSFVTGYVDLDDMLNTDGLSFQSIMLHFLKERAVTKDYERRIGTNIPFDSPHEAGHQIQAEHFQDIFKDSSIRYIYEEAKSGGKGAQIVFKSNSEKYKIFVNITGLDKLISKAVVFVITKDGKKHTVEDFLKTRTP